MSNKPLAFNKRDIVTLQSDNYHPTFFRAQELVIMSVRPESDLPFKCCNVHGQVSFFAEDDLRIRMYPTPSIEEVARSVK